jgi:hypothetical protein
MGKGESPTMKKAIVALILFFLLCIPAFAADDFEGQFGANAGVYFFNSDWLDDNGFFGGVEYRADMWSIQLDYVNTKSAEYYVEEVLVGGDTEQMMFAHLDYIYYFNQEDYTTENPTYVGLGYTHRFLADAVDDKGGFNVVLGMDWEVNWNFEARYIYFDSDDSAWGIGVGYFME